MSQNTKKNPPKHFVLGICLTVPLIRLYFSLKSEWNKLFTSSGLLKKTSHIQIPEKKKAMHRG